MYERISLNNHEDMGPRPSYGPVLRIFTGQTLPRYVRGIRITVETLSRHHLDRLKCRIETGFYKLGVVDYTNVADKSMCPIHNNTYP